MRHLLHVNTGNYNIEISDNSFEKLFSDINTITQGKKRLFVISKKVFNLYNTSLKFPYKEILVLPDGENEKNYKNYLKILETASEKGLDRTSVLIAIGGGVIGDITGFAASTYMRGIDFIQVPTTLLSMVDSSVGGKTAIDLKSGKNLVGTFYQPSSVFINLNFLQTLDKKQFMSGLGEILKYAFIENVCGYEQPIYFFEYLTLCKDKLYELDSVTLMRVIDYCLKLKIAVVEQDEKESSLRKILNFGHTVAHTIETITKYKKYTHGEAVVQGMFFAFETAYRMEMINYSYYRLSTELLENYGFKRLNLKKKFNSEKFIEIMQRDKKAHDDKIVFILPCDKKSVKVVTIKPSAVFDYINR